MKSNEFVFWIKGYCDAAIANGSGIYPHDIVEIVDQVISTMGTQNGSQLPAYSIPPNLLTPGHRGIAQTPTA